MNTNGVWQEEKYKIEEIVVEYYKNLFTTSNPTEFTKLLNVVEPKVT